MSTSQVLIFIWLGVASLLSMYLVFLRNISVRYEIFPTTLLQFVGAIVSNLCVYIFVFTLVSLFTAGHPTLGELPRIISPLISLPLTIFLCLRRSRQSLDQIIGTRWIGIGIFVWLVIFTFFGRIVYTQILYATGLWEPFPISTPRVWSATVLGLISTLAIAPVFEEIFFRGICIHGLQTRFKTSHVIFLTAFFFTLPHMEFYSTFCLGLFTAWAYVRMGTIYAPIAIHLGFNLLSQAHHTPLIRHLLPHTAESFYFKGGTLLIAIAVVVIGVLFRKYLMPKKIP